MLSCCYNYFPETIRDDDWSKLLKCTTLKERLHQIKFYRLKEDKSKKDAIKKQVKMSLKERCLDQLQSQRYITSLLLDPNPCLVVDCQFLECLSIRGLNLTFLQLKYLIAENRLRQQPWPLYLCNFNYHNDIINDHCKRHLQFFESNHFPCAEISSKSFVDLFAHSNIVYLSPHADEELDEIKGDETFILGGIVDRTNEIGLPKQASLLAAKQANVVARKLPLDKYIKFVFLKQFDALHFVCIPSIRHLKVHLEWKSGTKLLTLTAVASILYDVYDSNGAWEFALKKNIPRRNVKSAEEVSAVGRLKRKRINDYDERVMRELLQRLHENSDR
ncbi:unnamed protein product [Anisakis simplex]|uniref:SAM-dependent MTase TRM10-type domain-containing protein n=1 Tax=Anisakis simplex TaxID=6269 RepID=A0A0M3IZE5_ANISI|nr:unnamed protein product [Anisakis simplex]